MNARILGLAAALAAAGVALPAHAAEKISCAYPYWFGFAPTMVAEKLGYFAEEGLEVTWVFDNDRANVYPALETNEVNCSMRTIGEHMSRPLTADSNLVVIGVIDVSVGADGVVGAPGINLPTDLIGKVFAGEINHPGTVMTAHALKQAGHSLDEVDLRLIATDDASAVFEDPEVAAPTYDVTPEVMAGDLGGVYYTSYEDALEFFGVGGRNPKLKDVIDSLNEINVMGTYYVTREAVANMTAGARIVVTASVWGKTGAAGFSAYCASKDANITGQTFSVDRGELMA